MQMEIDVPNKMLKNLRQQAGAKAKEMSDRGLVLSALSEHINESASEGHYMPINKAI